MSNVTSIAMYNIERCSYCDASNVILKKCGGCRLAYYCGTDCQSSHWRIKHRYECRDMKSKGVKAVISGMPKCALDGYVTLDYKDWGVTEAVCKVTDFYVWCVDENNNVHDYPVEQIESEHWTNKVIRRPFDIEHAMRKYQFMLEFRKHLGPYSEVVAPLTQEEKMRMIEEDTFPPKQCLDRALTLRNSDPRKFAVVIGSLGFIQRDGSIFWEFG